jgi:hypothetical protein
MLKLNLAKSSCIYDNISISNKLNCYIVFVVQYTLDRCKLIVFLFFVCLFVMHTAYGISSRNLIFIAICFVFLLEGFASDRYGNVIVNATTFSQI